MRIAKYLSDKGYEVIIATPKPMNNIPKTNPHNAKVRQLDYNSDEQLNEAMKGIDILNTPCWTQYTFILI